MLIYKTTRFFLCTTQQMMTFVTCEPVHRKNLGSTTAIGFAIVIIKPLLFTYASLSLDEPSLSLVDSLRLDS